MSLVRDSFAHNSSSLARLSARFSGVVASSLLISLSLAAPAHAQAAAGPSPAMNIVPFVVMAAVFFFLVIRPQMKKQKDHAAFVSSLKRGEEVLTTGGILGRIEGLTELYVTLEIAPNTRIRILRSQIASNMPTANAAVEVKT